MSNISASISSSALRRPWWRSSKIRLLVIALVLAGTLGYLGYAGFKGGASFFLTVPEVQARGPELVGKPLRVKGQVVPGSVHGASPEVRFSIGEAAATLPVVYQGVMPGVFANKDIPPQDISVIAEGKLSPDGVFQATNVLVQCPSKWVAATKETR